MTNGPSHGGGQAGGGGAWLGPEGQAVINQTEGLGTGALGHWFKASWGISASSLPLEIAGNPVFFFVPHSSSSRSSPIEIKSRVPPRRFCG